MTLSAWPRLAELLSYHQRVVEALGVLDRQRAALLADPRSSFYGLTVEAFIDELRGAREELDAQVVMSLVASCEATLRMDAKVRIQQRTKDRVRKAFQGLEKKQKKRHQRVDLEDIIDVWKKEGGASIQAVGQFKQLFLHRHWLAHGRYWSDKSGIAPDPETAQLIIERFFDALIACVPDFPRT